MPQEVRGVVAGGRETDRPALEARDLAGTILVAVPTPDMRLTSHRVERGEVLRSGVVL